jgi:hypothetical protein
MVQAERVVEGGPSWLIPMQGMVASGRRWSIERFRGDVVSGKERDIQAEAIEVITTEGGQENPADLIVVASDLEFLGGAADGEIVDENLGLIDGENRFKNRQAEGDDGDRDGDDGGAFCAP